ncbi:hypothetical protein CLDAP_21690 [Caldilinea aerophila DSM 14535 = NBRC 104270]|uniref:Uncharacterized protein n=1 Tax=Caldilinea aerophila (strain DSM 14535 / JCM 11387 / NBRC 104270 / STL-6-O1) TaxID=926550 RepID=I0I4M1_CALAS|nr:hypothetical protein CLDAP_21690 [Caldilinea aerophila DSM 14535 = NBRC 104270]
MAQHLLHWPHLRRRSGGHLSLVSFARQRPLASFDKAKTSCGGIVPPTRPPVRSTPVASVPGPGP